MIALVIIVLTTAIPATAAPNLNNESQEQIAQTQQDQVSTESLEPPKEQERVIVPNSVVSQQQVTWRDNPNQCTDEQWISEEPPFECIDKPNNSPPVESDSQQTTQATSFTTDKQTLMRQAGIPEHEWAAADEIIARESGWDHLIWNRQGSGAYGLCQSLPASKMASAGSDWRTNPVTQLRWCHQYAQGYGGWIKAAQYSRCVGNCFSTRTNSYVYKDHAWW